MIAIEQLQKEEIHKFWYTFKNVLETQFPGYTKNVVRYFLDQIYSERDFVFYLQTKQKTIFTAKNDGQIVGFAVIDSPYGGVSLCRWLGIKPEFQKKGIGTSLIGAWLRLAREQGCHKAEVAAQPEAKGFYEKVGLNLEGKRELSYFGIDQYIFGKIIGPVNESILIKS